MKRVLLPSAVVLVAFVVGVGSAMLLRRPTASPSDPFPLPLVSFCQLFSTPEAFEGRTVRVRAVYSWGNDGGALGDSLCPEQEYQTAVVINGPSHDLVYRSLIKAWGPGVLPPNLDVIVVGRFSRNHPSHVGNSLVDHAPFRFELFNIERATRAD